MFPSSCFLCMNERFSVAKQVGIMKLNSLSVLYFNMLNNYIAMYVEAWIACTKALP